MRTVLVPAPRSAPKAGPALPSRLPLGELLDAPGTTSLVVSASRDVNAKVVVLVLPPGAQQPSLAVKVATTDIAAQAVEREGRLLCDLARHRLPTVGATLPRFVRVVDADGRPGVACTALPGVPMSTGYHSFRHLSRPSRVRRDFALVADWLAGFQRDTESTSSTVSSLELNLAVIAQRWSDSRPDALRSLLDPTLGRMRGCPLPRTAVHGDLWFGNLLVSDGALTGVVDWEHGSLQGDPLRDIARFALSYSLYLDRHTAPGHHVRGHRPLLCGSWGAGIAYAIDGQGWYPDVVARFVSSALARLSASTVSVRDVLLAGLADVAATADHPDFAEQHLDLLLRLAERTPRS